MSRLEDCEGMSVREEEFTQRGQTHTRGVRSVVQSSESSRLSEPLLSMCCNP